MQNQAGKLKHKKVKSVSRLGTLFREKRLAKGVALKQVAEYLNVSPERIELYETGAKSIPLSHVYALSNCLNISAKQILSIIAVDDEYI